MSELAGATVSAILRHDSKVTSYKIALLRAINDVVLAFPELAAGEQAVAIPLNMLAERWIASYWPFADPQAPVLQGRISQRDGRIRQDIAFRRELAHLYQLWEQVIGGPAQPSDGHVLVAELRLARHRAHYPAHLLDAYNTARHAIVDALHMPIRYAGPRNQEWSVFPRPVAAHTLAPGIVAVPGTQPAERCLLIEARLWHAFRDLSLWIEALCVHEWSLFVERISEGSARRLDRGAAYRMLTAQPQRRRPLTWERNQVELMLLEGASFTCPWTERPIAKGALFDLDHVLPLAVYPMNDLWNLVPADPAFNQHAKRDRIPSLERLQRAEPYLAQTYQGYLQSRVLREALVNDIMQRFRDLRPGAAGFPQRVAQATVRLVDDIGIYRNLARF